MAGPEDSATSSHHQGNPPDTSSDLRLQTTEEEDSLLSEKNNNPPAINPSASHATEGPHSTDTYTAATVLVKPGEHLRIDLREGKGTKQRINVQTALQSSDPNTSLTSYANMSQTSNPETSQTSCPKMPQTFDPKTSQTSYLNMSETSYPKTSQTSDPKTSQPVCQDDEASDVFDVSSHYPHFFFIEDDDDDVEEEDLGDDAFEESDREQEGEEDIDNERFSLNVEEDSEGGKIPGQSHSHEDVPRSTPWTIPSPSASPLATVCRSSHGSQVVVRCQIQSSPGSSPMRKASSCPTAFSPLWTQVMPVERRGSGSAMHAEDGEQRFGRKRLNTVAGTKTRDSRQLSSPRQQELGHDHDPVSPQDDPSHVSFKGRSRSYSDSDVQRLLVREVSKELRRMGDEFFRSRGRRMTRLSEPIIEENSTFDM